MFKFLIFITIVFYCSPITASTKITLISFLTDKTGLNEEFSFSFRKEITKDQNIYDVRSIFVDPRQSIKDLRGEFQNKSDVVIFLNYNLYYHYSHLVPRGTRIICLSYVKDEEDLKSEISKSSFDLTFLAFFPDIESLENTIASKSNKKKVYILTNTFDSPQAKEASLRKYVKSSEIVAVSSNEWNDWKIAVKNANRDGSHIWMSTPIGVKENGKDVSWDVIGDWLKLNLKVPNIGWGARIPQVPRLLVPYLDPNYAAVEIANIIKSKNKKSLFFNKVSTFIINDELMNGFKPFLDKISTKFELIFTPKFICEQSK